MAFGNVDEWHGVYSQSDSGPTMLGPKIWKHVSGERAHADALEQLRTRLFASGGVEAFLAGEPPGQRLEVSTATAHPLHISYVYVIDPIASKLHVLRADPRAEVIPIDPQSLSEPEEWHYVCLASCLLRSAEPDWKACGAEWREANCERHIRPIRERFGEEAAASARRQWLGD